MHEKVGKLRKTQTEESTVIQQTTPNAIILGLSQETENRQDVRTGPRALRKALKLHGLQGMSARPDRLAEDGASRRGHWTRVAPKRMWNTRRQQTSEAGGRQGTKTRD